MLTVIIPARDESATIRSVIEFVRRDPRVTEVIVIDDGSIDGTRELAEAAGARAFTSALLGKGASMEEGAAAAKNDLLLYLDGDLEGLEVDLVERMTDPLITGQADFVKARFSRQAGRVTRLTARPLLAAFFPELESFEQPLGGVIASRRSLLRRLRFENDYGVDVAILIDVMMQGARVVQVDIGSLRHRSQSLDRLEEMAVQVSRTILQRAAGYGRLQRGRVREAFERERASRAGIDRLGAPDQPPRGLVLCDIDGVLTDTPFLHELARETGRSRALARCLAEAGTGVENRVRLLARLFRGVRQQTFFETARRQALAPGAVETVVQLRRLGFRVGILSDGFFIAAEVIRRRVFADFCLAHVLRFRDERATGEVRLHPEMTSDDGCARHRICRRNALATLRDRLQVAAERVIAIGRGDEDACLLAAAGCAVAYRSGSEQVRAAATHVIDDSFGRVLEIARTFGATIGLSAASAGDSRPGRSSRAWWARGGR